MKTLKQLEKEKVKEMIQRMEKNCFTSDERKAEAKDSLVNPHTTYTVRTEPHCCHVVNRNRYTVETLTRVRDGKVKSTTCSWCGGPVPAVSEEELVLDGAYDTVGVHVMNSRLFWAGYSDSFYLAD